MEKRIRLINLVLVVQTVIVIPLFFLVATIAWQTEELRMTDQYVFSFGERLLADVLYALLSPSILVTLLLPMSWRAYVRDNILLMIGINIVATGSLLFVIFAIFSKIMPKRK